MLARSGRRGISVPAGLHARADQAGLACRRNRRLRRGGAGADAILVEAVWGSDRALFQKGPEGSANVEGGGQAGGETVRSNWHAGFGCRVFDDASSLWQLMWSLVLVAAGGCATQSRASNGS
jgi:hypothetical protein